MYAILQFLRRIIPKPVFSLYHRILSLIAAIWYGFPSRKLVVIGVTGTSGKTSTCYLISKILEADGSKTGMMTTALFKVGERSWENRTKMTMLGRFQTQRLLRDMLDAGCRYAVIETTSQGIVQHRHEHIAYDVVVFTNLWPEHVEAHGGFNAYKRAKIRLFEYASKLPRKTLNGKMIPRVEVLNGTSEHAADFALKGFDQVLTVGTGAFTPTNIRINPEGSTFDLDGATIALRMPGRVNIENALAALGVADVLGMPRAQAIEMLSLVTGLPGRYERIDEGQPFTVIVDYAFEPGAMEKLYELVTQIPHHRVIHVLGSAGGGRDTARRPVLGRMAGVNADTVIVTNEDPYDDDPRVIMNQVATGAMEAGKRDGVSLFRVEDRSQAIRQAIGMAESGDVVLITGKGSEPVMVVAGGKKMPWSDAEEARKALKNLKGVSA